MRTSLALAGVLVLAACASDRDDGSGIRIVRRTPDEFCRGTARSIAVDRYVMKQDGKTLADALEANGGVAVVDAITRAVYARDPRSESAAADVGTSACRAYFR